MRIDTGEKTVTLDSTMDDLLKELEEVERGQRDIKHTYARAAEMDGEYRAFKDREHKVRYFIARKVGC